MKAASNRSESSSLVRRRAFVYCAVYCAALAWILGIAAPLAHAEPENRPTTESGAAALSRAAALRFGWFDWDPYQYLDVQDRERVLTGLDVELVREIADGADSSLVFEERTWAGILRGLEDGSIDVSVGYRRPDRDAFVRYSFPYRLETEIIMVRRGEARLWPQADLTSLLEAMSGRFRIGVVEGYVYGPERFDRYLGDPANADYVVESASDREGFLKLLAGDVDGIVMDRTVAATIAWRNGWLDEVEELPLIINQDNLFMLFSKASTTPQQLDAFNQSLVRLRDDGGFGRIILAYLHPILIAMTIESNWFIAIDLLGTVAFAISGLVLAIRERYSVLGAVVLAGLPAVGGGLLRDLLVSREPVGVVSTPLYAELIVGTVLVGYLLVRAERMISGRNGGASQLAARARQFGQVTVEFFDSLGLASFTVTGVAVAVSSDVRPLWLWGPLLAVLTAAGGGVMRDVVRGRIDESSLKVAFYPEVAVAWGFALSAYLAYTGADLTARSLFWAVVITLAGAFLTRTLAYWRGWKAPAYG